MKDEKKSSNSAIPLVLIVLVFAAVVGGAYYLYQDAKNSSKTGSPTPAPANTARQPANAPIGANPPNMLGSPTAAVTIEEFADFQCGSCGAVHPVMKEIQGIYGSKIKMIFRNYPLQMHDKAYDAAIVAEAAGIQGRFWQMQDQLFTNQQTWSLPSSNAKELWKSYAEKIGLNIQQFENDVAGMAAKSRVDQDLARGKALNVSSTPTIYINGEQIPFQMANVQGLKAIIDQKLQEAATTQQSAKPQPAAPANSAASSNSNASSK